MCSLQFNSNNKLDNFDTNNRFNEKIENIIVNSTSPILSPTSSNTLIKNPLIVLISGAAGQVAYALVFMIARGDMFGLDQPIFLHLLDLPNFQQNLKGLEMELQDVASKVIKGIKITSNLQEAFTNIDIAILLGSFPTSVGMQRIDLLEKNSILYKQQALALNEFASRNVKVLVVGNPSNTNALITINTANNIPRNNFTSLMLLDQNRAISMIAAKLGIHITQVKNVIIWGNHSPTQFVDIKNAFISDYPIKGKNTPIIEAINDPNWEYELNDSIRKRGSLIFKARKLTPAASAAIAIINHMQNWFFGTKPGEFVSMGVISDGNSFGIEENLVCSFPVCCQQGTFEIKKQIVIDQQSLTNIQNSIDELIEERKIALHLIHNL
eukprot:TRINITY_DN2212_c0_g1_i1.p1 TRINITY_DN2212_c0_g1~~TRINITY_DN2212_c0_g1_i1.p1  ORF type:complete len:382 (-),score=158.01 TRINITY_DN2212_c0_g1_i1:49-1194(-)